MAAPSYAHVASFGCDTCGTFAVALKVCKRCKIARYCSVKCQSAHWPRHKQTCVPAERVPWLQNGHAHGHGHAHDHADAQQDPDACWFVSAADARIVADRQIEAREPMKHYWDHAAAYVAQQKDRQFKLVDFDAEFRTWETHYWKGLPTSARAVANMLVPEHTRAMQWMHMVR